MTGMNLVKVFTATKARDREALGEVMTEWIRQMNVEILDKVVTQSSDSEFHCLSITLFCRKSNGVPKRV
jgi:hypothetical protein